MYIYIYVYYVVYIYMHTYRFISPRLTFWFLPNLRRLKIFEYFESFNTSLRRLGTNQNRTLGEINLLLLIYMTQHKIQSLHRLKLKLK